jgi:hypothetical protein
MVRPIGSAHAPVESFTAGFEKILLADIDGIILGRVFG